MITGSYNGLTDFFILFLSSYRAVLRCLLGLGRSLLGLPSVCPLRRSAAEAPSQVLSSAALALGIRLVPALWRSGALALRLPTLHSLDSALSLRNSASTFVYARMRTNVHVALRPLQCCGHSCARSLAYHLWCSVTPALSRSSIWCSALFWAGSLLGYSTLGRLYGARPLDGSGAVLIPALALLSSVTLVPSDAPVLDVERHAFS